jgi:hypothetical protein
MTFEHVVMAIIAASAVLTTIYLALIKSDQHEAKRWLEEVVDELASLRTVNTMNQPTAAAQRERIIKAIEAIPVRPPLATVGHASAGHSGSAGNKGHGPATTLPLRVPVGGGGGGGGSSGGGVGSGGGSGRALGGAGGGVGSGVPSPALTPLRPPADEPTFPKPVKVADQDPNPHTHPGGPPSPSPKAWERYENKRVDEDWPQHD